MIAHVTFRRDSRAVTSIIRGRTSNQLAVCTLHCWIRGFPSPSIVHSSLVLMSSPRSRNAIVAMGLVAFAAAGLAFPFLMGTLRKKPLIDSSKPLPPQATFRGPYVNTGSRDIGLDPKRS